MEWWSAVAAMISRLLDEHGLPTAFVLLFLEEAGVPPLLPGDVLMILIGIRAAAGKVGLLEALAILQAATLLGGSILYWVSAWGGQALFYRIGRYVGATRPGSTAPTPRSSATASWPSSLDGCCPGCR
jgi:membrane protein DedA with SNARE-associated domain